MTADVPVVATEKQFFGKICKKHPESRGLRRICDKKCVQCRQDLFAAWLAKPENREKHCQYQRDYTRQPEKQEHYREYYQRAEVKERRRKRECQPKAQARKKEYYQQNREKIAERNHANFLRNRDKVLKRSSEYRRKSGGDLCTDLVGSSSELFAAVDLMTKGLTVYRPLRTTGPHDLCVELNSRLYTVQVKTADVSTVTGLIIKRCRAGITSEIIAFVDLAGRRVRWVSNTSEPLPEILQARSNDSARANESQATQENK